MKRGKLTLLLSTILCLFGLAVGGISTMAWFQAVQNQTLETGLVSGSKDVEVGKVYGYKVKQERKSSDGFVNYGNTTVTKMDYDTASFSTENSDQEGADINFDIPNQGIGYYLIPKVSSSFKYSNTGTQKLKQYESDSNIAYAENTITITGESAYRIKEYGFQNSKTVSVKREISKANMQCTDTSAVTFESDGGDIVLSLGAGKTSATFKFWLDYSSWKVGFEVTGSTTSLSPAPLSDNQGPRVKRLYGTERIYVEATNISVKGAGGHILAHFFGGTQSDLDVEMTNISNTEYYYYDLNIGNNGSSSARYKKVIFVRAPTSTLDWSNIWNQSDDQSLDLANPYSSNNCWISSGYSNGRITGSWGSYNYSPEYELTVGSKTEAMSWYTDANGNNHKEYRCFVEGCTANEQVSVTLNGTGLTLGNGSGNLTTNNEIITSANVMFYLDIVDKTIWAEYYTMTIAGTTHNLVFDSTGGEYKAAGVQCVVGDQITSTKKNGSSITTTRKNESNNNINNEKKVITSGSVDFYWNPSTNVIWASGYGSTYFIQFGDSEPLAMVNNPDNANEVQATGLSLTSGDAITIYSSGSAITNFGGADTAFNNFEVVNNVPKVIASATGVGAYYNKNANTLWLDGNKTYELYIDGTALDTPMVYYTSGDAFNGWQKQASVSVNAGDSLDIKLNGTSVSNKTYNYQTSTNNLSSSYTIKATGTVDVYYNTSSPYQIYVTPVYSVKIGNSDPIEAAFNSTYNYYKTGASFSISGQDEYSVAIYCNDTALSNIAPGNPTSGPDVNSTNNAKGSAGNVTTVCYSDSAVYAILDIANSKIFVSGYHDPVYSAKYTRGGGNPVSISLTNESGTYTGNYEAAVGDVLTFYKNKSTQSPNLSGDGNNVEKSGNIYTILHAGTVTIKWNPGSGTLWVSGQEFTYYFVNSATDGGKLLTGATMYAYPYVSGSPDVPKTSWPGIAMTNVSGDIWKIDLTYDRPYSNIIFTDGTGNGHQTNNLALSGNEGKYYWLKDNTMGKNPSNNDCYTNGAWYSTAPITAAANKTIYLHDKYWSTHFNSSLYGYAETSSGTTVPNAGAVKTGAPATAIITGSLYKVSFNSGYDRLTFTNGSRDTAPISVSGVSSGSVFVAASALADSKVAITPATVMGNSVFGTATIALKKSDGTSRSNTTMRFGDRSGAAGTNYFIYEEGVAAEEGDTFTITYSGSSLFNLTGSGTLDGNSFVRWSSDSSEANYHKIQTEHYPFLTFGNQGVLDDDGRSGTITINSRGRYNFYVTHDGRISVAMVPYSGNGFYVIPYVSTTEGYINAIKMNTESSSSASYDGYKVDATSSAKRFYVRSYMSAVDTLYETAVIDSSLSSDVSFSNGVITFDQGFADYVNIEVANNTVYINEFVIDDFFCLNKLDASLATSQSYIQAQRTSLVLEVQFTVQSARELDIYIDIANPYYTTSQETRTYYVGCSTHMTNAAQKLSTPWEYMMNNKYSLSSNSSLKAGTTSGAGTYYAYILIDYMYSSGLPAGVRGLSGSMSFEMRVG